MAPAPSAPSLTILVVEDEPIIALNTEMMLSTIGFENVEVVGSVAEAMALIDRLSIEFAILDFSLGSETSIPVAVRLCEEKVPIVITTGFEEVDLPPACAGTPILRKPYRLGELETVVASFR
ncbi:response regulator [Sphingobium nicotianae]|uniref:Response regulator n=1 Tax=Sphingobium nicotianae TaxID=2782607 RepID=A0A9X1DDR1_9SPHN|nr:response regulator [Sphingobium nicotianae]MBT2188045.1 response regulator [Sphingobium nicotianae]